MLSFIEYIQEVRLSRIAKTIEGGGTVGTVSPERDYMNPEQKAAAHSKIQSRLKREQKKGRISSWSGPHGGDYQYADPKPGEKKSGLSREGSYVVRAEPGSKAHKRFGGTIRQLGRSFGQESVFVAKKKGKKAKGHLAYTGGENKGKVEPKGEIRYNRPLRKDTGRTTLKHSASSFTAGGKED